MSIDIMNRIWWREDIPMMEKFVAMALADAANDEGVAYPAVATIALKCSCSERAVQKSVKALCAKGLMRKTDRRDRSSFYIFVLENLPLVERERRRKEAGPHAELTGEPRSPDLFGTGERHSPRGERHSPTGERGAPRTISETSEEPSTESLGDFRSEITAAAIGDDQLEVDAENIEPSLADHVETRWKELKARHPGIAAVRKIDDGLKHTIALRAKQHAQTGQTAIDVWNEVLDAVDRSEFLTGRVQPGPGREAPFKLSLAWLTNATKFREVIGGKFDGNRDPKLYHPETGRRLGPTEQALRSTIAGLRAGAERGRGTGTDAGAPVHFGGRSQIGIPGDFGRIANGA